MIFTTARVAARRGVLAIFNAIATHPNLSKHVVEIVFDCSWFDPHIVELYAMEKHSEGRDNYIEAFHEQERILAHEMGLALFNAVRAFTKLRRVICADYYRFSGFLGDRLEDLGPDFRLEGDDLPVQKLLQTEELECYHPSLTIGKLYEDKNLRRRYWPLTYLLLSLADEGVQAKVEDIRLGDSMYSRDVSL